MSQTLCGCGKPTRDKAPTCDGCLATLATDLAEVPWLDGQLDIALARRRGVNLQGSGASAERGLPWDERAAKAGHALRNALMTWVRVCHESGIGHELPRDRPAAMAAWLTGHLGQIRFHEAGFDLAHDLGVVIDRARDVVYWKPGAKVYLGPCDMVDAYGNRTGCPGFMYAKPDGRTQQLPDLGTCDECGRHLRVEERRAQLDRELDDRLFTAAEIAGYVVTLGLPVSRLRARNQIATWARRKRLVPKGASEGGDPKYRYGDVAPLLYATYGEREERA